MDVIAASDAKQALEIYDVFWYHVKHGKSTGKVVLHEKTQRHVKHAA